jgi:hypothetical protein
MAEMKPNAAARPHRDVRRTTTHFGVTHVRAYHSDRYTIVGNHLAQHRELSLTAIGLATHILSLPDGAPVDIRSLAERFPEGRDRIAFALRELEACGYVARVRKRTPAGRLVTRTYAHHAPGRAAAPSAPGHRRPAAARGGNGSTSSPLRSAPEPVPAAASPFPEPSPAPEPTVPPHRPAAPVPAPAPVDPIAPAAVTNPTAPAGPAEPAVPPEAAVTVPDGRHDRAATLLADLRRTDDRLTLSRRDVHRLAPAVTAWFDGGATAAAVRRTLTAGLPPDLRHPAGLVAHRLRELLPPPLPAGPRGSSAAATDAGALRPPPLQNCDRCDRAFRAHRPGRCRDCRSDPPTAVDPRRAA